MHNNRKYRHSAKNNRSHKLPDRWNKYTAMGNIVPGTRFLPFKTPLKEEICEKSLSASNWFTPAILLEKAPNIKLIIDLTQTERFYQKEDFVKNGVLHKKIWCPGGGKQLPPRHIIHEFNTAIDGFLESEDAVDGNALIGVHCTHGLNRTGYLICKYMVQRHGVEANEAIKAFEDARGHKMERDLYVSDILGSHLPQPAPHRSHPPQTGPHRSHRQQTRFNRRADPHPYQRYPPLEGLANAHPCHPYPSLERLENAHPYHRYSPMEGCYSERRRSYSDRNIFYPQFR